MRPAFLVLLFAFQVFAGCGDTYLKVVDQFVGEERGESDFYGKAKVPYLTPEEREQWRIEIRGGRFFQNGRPMISRGHDPFQLVRKDGDYFGRNNFGLQGQRFHHSAYFAGDEVSFGGEMLFDDSGHLRVLTDKSGHYLPTPWHTRKTLIDLKGKGVDLTDVKVGLSEVGMFKATELVENLKENDPDLIDFVCGQFDKSEDNAFRRDMLKYLARKKRYDKLAPRAKEFAQTALMSEVASLIYIQERSQLVRSSALGDVNDESFDFFHGLYPHLPNLFMKARLLDSLSEFPKAKDTVVSFVRDLAKSKEDEREGVFRGLELAFGYSWNDYIEERLPIYQEAWRSESDPVAKGYLERIVKSLEHAVVKKAEEERRQKLYNRKR